MQPEERDLALLWDMREAARDILKFVRGVTYTKFAANKILRYAVERQLLVIGEAAKHISESFKQAHPEIPWSSIIAQRNVLAHEYGEVLIERIWLVATERISELISLLDPLIPEPPNPDEPEL
ncbi:MAG: DUF86 domain-containing protein [bacterium]